MNTKKTMISVLLILSMVLCSIPSTTLEASSPDASNSVSLTIHKYKLDNGVKWEDLNPHDGSKIDESSIDGIPLSGVTFTIILMELKDDDLDPSDPDSYQTHPSNVQLRGTTDDSGMLTFDDAAYQEVYGSSQGQDAKLPQGVYMVQELLENGLEAQPGSDGTYIVSLPMTDPASNADWLYNVHLYPKNMLSDEELIFEKKVLVNGNEADEKNVEAEETVTWRVKSQIPEGIGKSKEYKLTDTFDERLEYIADTLSLYYLDENGTPKILQEGINPSDAENETDLRIKDYWVVWDLTNRTFFVYLTENGRQMLGAAETLDQRLYMEFKTTVHIQEIKDIESEIVNKALLDYTNQFNEKYHKEDEAKVYTGGLEIIKVDGKSYNEQDGAYDFALEDVEFRLYRQEGQNEYYGGLDSNGEIVWTSNELEALILTTNEEGIIRILGLLDGIYYIEELKTVEGYTLLQEDIEIIIAVKDLSGEQVRYNYGLVSRYIENYKGFTLPLTGDRAILIFLGTGILLVILGVALWGLYKGKRKRQRI